MTNKTQYRQIKNWFENNQNELPETLEGECAYYGDLKKTVKIIINLVDHIIEKKTPSEIKNNAIAAAGKANLVTIWKDLQWKPGWNLPHCKTPDEQTQRNRDRAKSKTL